MEFKERTAWLNNYTSQLAKITTDMVEAKFLLKKLIQEAKTALDEIEEHHDRVKLEQKRRDKAEVIR